MDLAGKRLGELAVPSAVAGEDFRGRRGVIEILRIGEIAGDVGIGGGGE